MMHFYILKLEDIFGNKRGVKIKANSRDEAINKFLTLWETPQEHGFHIPNFWRVIE